MKNKPEVACAQDARAAIIFGAAAAATGRRQPKTSLTSEWGETAVEHFACRRRWSSCAVGGGGWCQVSYTRFSVRRRDRVQSVSATQARLSEALFCPKWPAAVPSDARAARVTCQVGLRLKICSRVVVGRPRARRKLRKHACASARRVHERRRASARTQRRARWAERAAPHGALSLRALAASNSIEMS